MVVWVGAVSKLAFCHEPSQAGQAVGTLMERRECLFEEGGDFNYSKHGHGRVGWVLEAIATIHLAIEDACLAQHNSLTGAYSPLWLLSPTCFFICSILAADVLLRFPVLLLPTLPVD